jgi:hypothetical protein
MVPAAGATMSDPQAEMHWDREKRIQEIERLADVAAARIGCTCPLIYDRGGRAHDPDCPRERTHRLLITALVFWDGYLAWLSMSQVARTLAEDAAAHFQPEDLDGALALKAETFRRWQAGHA